MKMSIINGKVLTNIIDYIIIKRGGQMYSIGGTIE
jgi:hypothetical protein